MSAGSDRLRARYRILCRVNEYVAVLMAVGRRNNHQARRLPRHLRGAPSKRARGRAAPSHVVVAEIANNQCPSSSISCNPYCYHGWARIFCLAAWRGPESMVYKI